MTRILIVKATPAALIAQGRYDFAAPFGPALQALDAGVTISTTNPYDSPWQAEMLAGVDAVIFAGSSVDWSTSAPEAEPLRDAMEDALDSGLPIWGSCNGLQLAAVVLGGAVGPSPRGVEEGLARDIRLTGEGRLHPMMAGRADVFTAPAQHRDEVTRLPKGAQLLASNAHSLVQAMAYRKGGADVWGVQYHPELPLSRKAQAEGHAPVELSNWLAHVCAGRAVQAA